MISSLLASSGMEVLEDLFMDSKLYFFENMYTICLCLKSPLQY